MNPRTKAIAIVLLGGFGLGGYEFHSFYSEEYPKLMAQVTTKEQSVQKMEAELARLKTFKANIENVKQELKALNLQLEAALEHMPRTFNLSALLRRLSLLAQNSGIEMFSFKPDKIQGKGEGGFYSTVTIDVNLKGTFTQSLLFLDQLSRLKRIINVENIRFRPVQGAPLRTTGVFSDAQAKIKTYKFTE